MELKGKNLISTLQSNSNIESSNFNYHFNEIIEGYNINPNELTLDQLREVLSDYLQNMILDLEK